jgi:Glycerophosphoryl diester phosphodiesterase family
MILPKSVQVLPRAYSHRDCELNPPLWVSLEHGFAHIEVDVYCMFGSVFVGHDLLHLRPQKTLEKLYLEPLQTHVQQQGKIFDGTRLYLFVDIKTPAKSSYNLLHSLFERYRHIITCFTSGTCNDKPITLVISGNRLPYQVMQEQQERYAVLDGRLEDLGLHTSPHVMPFISDDWQKHFRWQGHGKIPFYELEKLQGLVRSAHEHGQKVRFWGTPDKAGEARENLWQTLLEAGVDLISTDDIAGLQTFLATQTI